MKSVITVAIVAVALTAGGALAQHGGRQHSLQGQQAAQACIDEFNKVVGEGRGFGLGFAADQNGYPGPMHVLELKDRLKLTAEQEAKARELYAAVRAELPKSTRLMEADRLERLFADRAASEPAVRAAEEQRRVYHEARWVP
jgi:hypothetical protein